MQRSCNGSAKLGFIVGRNVRIDYRWGGGDLEHYHVIAAELIALSPDVILALGNHGSVDQSRGPTGVTPRSMP